MKNKTIKIAVVAVFAAIAGYGVYASQRTNIEMSDLMLANVEALANGEVGAGDTGPAEIVDCAGWGTGSKKECMCRNPYSCTPTSCS